MFRLRLHLRESIPFFTLNDFWQCVRQLKSLWIIIHGYLLYSFTLSSLFLNFILSIFCVSNVTRFHVCVFCLDTVAPVLSQVSVRFFLVIHSLNSLNIFFANITSCFLVFAHYCISLKLVYECFKFYVITQFFFRRVCDSRSDITDPRPYQ